jgi:hypothetical protein
LREKKLEELLTVPTSNVGDAAAQFAKDVFKLALFTVIIPMLI